MYLRYCERRAFRTELIEVSEGDVAGIKSATVKVTGEYAFGYLRTETGQAGENRSIPATGGIPRSLRSMYTRKSMRKWK